MKVIRRVVERLFINLDVLFNLNRLMGVKSHEEKSEFKSNGRLRSTGKLAWIALSILFKKLEIEVDLIVKLK